MNFAAFLEMHARGRPDAVAAIDRRMKLTYEQLDDAASRFAGLLASSGLAEGDRVCFHLPNRVELAIGLLGAFKAGVIAVPLNWRLGPADLDRLLRHARPGILVTSDKLRPNLPETRAIRLLTCGETARSGDFWTEIAAATPLRESCGRQAGDIANLLYTSGTTGTPKAVVHTHGMRAAIAGTMAHLFALSCRDTGIAVSPLFHTGGFSVFANAIFCGGALVLQESWNIDEFVAAVRREQVTFMHLVTTIVVDIVRAPADLFEGLPGSMRFAWGGGHAATPDLFAEFERRTGAIFIQGYSRTEGGITYNRLDASRRFDAHGYPNRNNTELVVMDRATGAPLPPGEIGEICFAGDGVSPGYWNDGQIVPSAERGERWKPTGDFGYLTDDGALVFTGRDDHMIKSGGENIYPSEVLSVLLAMPEIADAVVFDVPDERLGQTVAALVVPAADGLSASDVQAFCRRSLAGFKIPRRIGFVGSLPRLGSEKIDVASSRTILLRG